jgi:arylsulfatase A-like enzyme
MISVIDRRLAAIVDVYRERGRWDNTLMVLTSDHGQAFGEHGILFHTLRIDEGEIRIPLWVRYPDSPLVGEGVGWASLIDVAPTVLRAAGAPDWESPSGRDLGQLADKARSEPLLTMSDGLIWTHVDQMLTSERRAWLDQVFVGAYRDEFKVVLEARTGALSAYNIVRDSGEREDLMPQLGTQLESLVSAASAVGQRILGSGAPVRSQEVQDRLKSWGYI